MIQAVTLLEEIGNYKIARKLVKLVLEKLKSTTIQNYLVLIKDKDMEWFQNLCAVLFGNCLCEQYSELSHPLQSFRQVSNFNNKGLFLVKKAFCEVIYSQELFNPDIQHMIIERIEKNRFEFVGDQQMISFRTN